MAHVAVLDDRMLQPGRAQLVQLRLSEPLGVAPGDRFVIRAGIPGHAEGRTTTIGGGRILGVSNLRLRRLRQWTLDMLHARSTALTSPAAWCAQILRESPEPLSVSELARRALLAPAQVQTHLDRCCAEGVVVASGQGYLHRDIIAEAARRISETLSAFHVANPQAPGMEEQRLCARLALQRTVCALAIAQLIAARIVERQGLVIRLHTHTVKLDNEDDRCLQQIESAFRQAALCPPPPPNSP